MSVEIFGANLKMNPASKERNSFKALNELLNEYARNNIGRNKDQEVIIFYPPLFLGSGYNLGEEEIDKIKLGAQGISEYISGSHTGENPSPIWLRELKVTDVLIGHSEVRKHYEDLGSNSEKINQLFNRQIKNALVHNFRVTYCVGETRCQKEKDLTLRVLEKQIIEGLDGILDGKLIIAYEPRWSIGTDKIPTAFEIEEAHSAIKGFIGKISPLLLNNLRILYGGNMNHENASDIMRISGVNGGLIGRACLDPEKFSRIVSYKAV